MSKQINIGGRIHSTEVGNVSVGANEVFDDTKGKKQNVINSETDAELLRLDQSKQNNLTFDNTPTENSTNPVTSGGVYAANITLHELIEAILVLIPSAASALNQLADKAFVNSSVSTATATFRGTYNVVTDLELAYDATHEQIATKLGQVIATADNNDYAFVQVPVSATSTDIRRTERYKFNGTVWGYEYDLNTSGFTAVQWEAINSGITALLVSKLTNLPTAEVLATMFDAKQNVLTFDAAPTALSTNPVYSGGVYAAIKAITDLIPSEATALNQLADKAYVLASILAATPAFKGQFTSLVDLQAVSSPKAGDIGIVRTKDNDGKDVFTFYQYLNNQWNVYFSLSYHPQTKPATTGTTGDYPYNGMGRVELPMNIVEGVNTLIQSMMPTATGGNTIYVIKYDFTLGENITVPANCVLEFDGGSISGNGTGKDTITATHLLLNDWQFSGIKFSNSTDFDFICPINVPVDNAKEFIETILSYKSYNSLNPITFLFSSNVPYDWDGILYINKKYITLTGGGTIKGHIQVGVDADVYKEYEQSQGWDGNRTCITISNLSFNKIGKIGRVSNGGNKDTIISQSNVDNFIKYTTLADVEDNNYTSITLHNANHVKITDCFFHNVPFPVTYLANRAIAGEALPDPNDNNYIIQQVMRRINIANCDFERCYIAVYVPSNVTNILEYGDLEISFCNIFPHLHGLMIKHVDGFKCFNNVFNTGYDQANWESVNIYAVACFMHIANNGFYGELNVASIIALYPSSVQIVGNGFHSQHSSAGIPYKYKGLINIISDSNHYIGYCAGAVINNNLFNFCYALPIYINKSVRGCTIKGNAFSGTINEMYLRTLYHVGENVSVDELQPNIKMQSINNDFYADSRINAITDEKRNRVTFNSDYFKTIDFVSSFSNWNKTDVEHCRRITKVKPVVAISGSFTNLSNCNLMFNGVFFGFDSDYSTKADALTALKNKIDSLFSDNYNTAIIGGILWIAGKTSSVECYSPFIDLNRKLNILYQNFGYRVELWDIDNKNYYDGNDAFNAFDEESNLKSVIINNRALTQVCTKTADKYFTLSISQSPSGYSDIYIFDDTFFAKDDNSANDATVLSSIVSLCYSDRYSINGTTLTCLEANKEWIRMYRPYGWWCSAVGHVVDVSYVLPDGSTYNP